MACERVLAVPEILARILLLTIYQPTGFECSEGLDSENITISKRNPPWPFLLVSQYWRELVLTTPFLWSTIVIVLTEYQCSYADVARVLPLVDAHLQHSKTSPLTLLIMLREGAATRHRLEEGGRDPVVPIFALFGKVLERQQHWQDVDLCIEASEASESFPTTFTVRLGSMPMLKQLKLDLRAQEWCRQLIELGPCPHLDTIELNSNWDVVPRRPVESHRLDFPMLRTIYLRTQDPGASATCWNLLEPSSSVEDLELLLSWRSSPTWLQELSNSLVVFPLVRILTLRLVSSNAIRVLERFPLPSLTQLDLVHLQLDDDMLSCLTTFVKTRRITHLTLELDPSNESLGTSLFLDFVQCMDSLCCLTLFNISFGLAQNPRSSLITALVTAFRTSHLPSSGQGNGTIFPHLTSFVLHLDPIAFISIEGISPGKDLILELCRRYLTNFEFDLCFETHTAEHMRAEDDLYEDTEVQECVSNLFKVRINYLIVPGIPE